MSEEDAETRGALRLDSSMDSSLPSLWGEGRGGEGRGGECEGGGGRGV